MIDYNNLPDVDLYGMCLAGDEGAWQYVYNFILVICRSGRWALKDHAHELAQASTVHLLEKALKKVREKDKFRNFIKKMTINKIKDSFRAASHRNESLDDPVRSPKGDDYIPQYQDTNPTQEEVFFNLEVVSLIDGAIQKLPANCHKVVLEYLNFKMGKYEDYRELSRVLKMPVPTISARVSRCLEKLLQFKEIKELKPVAS